MIADQLGRVFARPTMVRIAEISGGNPFYALELARAMDSQASVAEQRLPGTLAELVRLRTGRFEGRARDVLLAAACVAAPTVELLARVNDSTAERIVELLEDAEADGVIGIDGNRVRFSHPLLARGVYVDAAPARRRAMHRALAVVESLPEVRARHLALAATSADEATLAALDGAADAARERGAPAAAAELLDMAIKLGGDTSYRRVRAAGDHFQAGDTDKAQALLGPIIDKLRPGALRAIALNLLAAMCIFENDFGHAIDLLTRAADDAKDVPAVLVQTLLSLSFAQGSGSFTKGTASEGEFDASLRHANRAVAIAEELGFDPLTSQALAMSVLTNFTYGLGVDEANLKRALELEDTENDVALPFNASAVHALVRAWEGRLDDGSALMQVVRRRCVNRGDDRNMMGVAAYSAMFEMWRANFTAGAAFAEEAMERAQQLGGKYVEVIPLSVRGAIAAYTGRLDDARADADSALRAAHECDAPRMTEWPLMTVGFIEVSLGNYTEALAALQPLLSRFAQIPGTEIMTAWFVPDAVEAMVALGLLDDAQPWIETLESNGRIAIRTAITEGRFDDNERMEQFDVIFAQRYFDALNAYFHGEKYEAPTHTWQWNFDGHETEEPVMLQHMLTAVNAHVNLDLGISAYKAATAGGNSNSLPSLEGDFGLINDLLAGQVKAFLGALSEVSPRVTLILRILPCEELVINSLLKVFRNLAWVFANQLASRQDRNISDIAVHNAWASLLGAYYLFPTEGLSRIVEWIGEREEPEVALKLQALLNIQPPSVESLV